MSTQIKSVSACGVLAISLLTMCLLQPSIAPAAKSSAPEVTAGTISETMEPGTSDRTASQTEQAPETAEGQESLTTEEGTTVELQNTEETGDTGPARETAETQPAETVSENSEAQPEQETQGAQGSESAQETPVPEEETPAEQGQETQPETGMALAATEQYFSAGMAAVLNEGQEEQPETDLMLASTEDYFSAGMATVMKEGSEAREAAEAAKAEAEARMIRVTPDVEKVMNIRAEASEESSITGKFYRGCVGEQIDALDGWIQIQSGAVTGWVSAEYVKTGAEADQMIAQTDPVVVTVNADTLNVRESAGTDAVVLAVVSRGQTFMAREAGEEWIEIFYTPDLSGYVAAEFVVAEHRAGQAVDMEMVNALQKLAEEKAAERRAQEKKQSIAVTTNSPMLAGADDTTLLAAVCQYEAGGSYEGALAVANVVLNRVRSGSYPNSIAEVIYAPGQFGGARSGALNGYLTGGVSSNARRAAEDALAGVNNVGDYTTFCSARIANVNAYSSYTIIGGNCFYRR